MVWNDTTFTVALSTLTFALLSFWKAVTLAQGADPLRHTVENGGEKSHPIFDVEVVALALTTLSASVSSSNVPIVWLNVVAKTQRLFLSEKAGQRTRTFLRLYQILSAFGIGASIFIKGSIGYFLAGITTLLSQAGIVMIYTIGHRWLSSLIESVTKDRHSLVLRRMKALTSIVLILMPISCFSSVAFAIFNIFGTENFCAAGRICIEVVTGDIILIMCKSWLCHFTPADGFFLSRGRNSGCKSELLSR